MVFLKFEDVVLKIFLSHNSLDKPVVRKFYQLLTDRGYHCFLDEEEIQVGDDIVIDGLNPNLAESDVALVFFSENSLKSRWVDREYSVFLYRQLSGADKIVIPILLEGGVLPEILASVLSVKLEATDYSGAIKQIEKGLSKFRPPSSNFKTDIAELGLKPDPPNQDFVLVTISGPSAVGKDAVLRGLEAYLKGRIPFEVLKKYSTRPLRSNEPEYSVPGLSKDAFIQLRTDGKVLFEYTKRVHLYGFDKTQFSNVWKKGGVLFVIFTDFEKVPDVTKTLRTLGAHVLNVYLDAKIETLLDRSNYRGFGIAEVQKRLASIENDKRIQKNRVSFKEEYTVLENDDDHSINGNVNSIVQLLEGFLQSS